MGFSKGILQHVHFGTGNEFWWHHYAGRTLYNRKITTTKNEEQTNHDNKQASQPPPTTYNKQQTTTQQYTTNNKQTTKNNNKPHTSTPTTSLSPRKTKKHHACGMIHLQCCDVCRLKSKGSRGDLRRRFGTNLGACYIGKAFPHDMRVTKNTLSIGILAF